MRFFRSWAGVVAVVAFLLAAVVWLFQLRLGGGDVYPAYSSLRADALGTRALYEALAEVPGMTVARDYRPLAQLGTKPRLVVLPGLSWHEWQSVPANQLEALNNAAASGARIVLAFYADVKRDQSKDENQPEQAGSEKKKDKDGKARDAKAVPPGKELKKKPPAQRGIKEWELKDLAKVWGVTLKQRWLFSDDTTAQRATGAPAELPEQLTWHSDVHFSVLPDSGWRVLYRRGGEPVAVEKTMGRGSVILLADAYTLSNEAMDRDRSTPWLAYLVGDQHSVVFVEGVLGVLEENGVGFLARRYGLGGALAICALLGVLYAWRRLVAFLPTQDGAGGEAVPLGSTAAPGFTGLLRRSLSRSEVVPACVDEWHKSQHRGNVSRPAAARLDAAWQSATPRQTPAAAYNALVRALKLR